MDDTQSSFPEMPDLKDEQKEGASQISQITHPTNSASEETASSLSHSDPTESMGALRPLTVLVFLPAGVVATIMFIAWLIKAAF
jgi:hypothetical protein